MRFISTQNYYGKTTIIVANDKQETAHEMYFVEIKNSFCFKCTTSFQETVFQK